MSTAFLNEVLPILEEQEVKKENIRAASKQLAVCARNFSYIVNSFHTEESFEQIVAKSKNALDSLDTVHSSLNNLVSSIQPVELYFRYVDLFNHVLQDILSSLHIFHFIAHGKICDPETIRTYLGIPVNDTSCFHITLEDFLQSIPPMISEIVRLAINRVPSKDYHFVTSTCTFVKEMYSNLQILNLRNDSLRRKVDGVKYELKRIEEVVFHLSMRNLI